MQPLPYLKLDNQKANLMLALPVPILALAGRLSAPLKKSPACSEGTLKGFRLERESGK